MEWIRNSLTKASLGAAIATSLLVSACGSEDVDVTPPDPIAVCKAELSNQDFRAVRRAANEAIEQNPENAEGHYCLMAANIGSIVKDISGLMEIVDMLSAPGYQTSALKGVALSIFRPIEESIAEIDRSAYALTGMNAEPFMIEDFSLDVDLGWLLEVTDDSETEEVEGELADIDLEDLSFDLSGSWDVSHVHVVAIALNSVQGVLDYLLSHKLSMELSVPDLTVEGIVKFLMDNDQLLVADDAHANRLLGDADRKGMRGDVIAALSYLVGRDAEEEGVAPVTDGLLAAIQASAGSDVERPVIGWELDDNGLPKVIDIPALVSVGMDSSEIELDLDKALIDNILAFVEDVLGNIENETPAVALKPLLDGLVDYAGESTAVSRLTARDVPDMLHINPGAFFAAPPPIRDMLPVFFSYEAYNEHGTASTHYDLAYETERYEDSVTVFSFVGGFTEHTTDRTLDYPHFDFAPEEGVVSFILFGDVEGRPERDRFFELSEFEETDLSDPLLEVDGLTPDAVTPVFYYVLLKDPTFGGFLEVDFTDVGGDNVATLDNHAFSEGINRLIDYYCVDFTKEIDFDFDFDKLRPLNNTYYESEVCEPRF